jgi:hypothetical protein
MLRQAGGIVGYLEGEGEARDLSGAGPLVGEVCELSQRRLRLHDVGDRQPKRRAQCIDARPAYLHEVHSTCVSQLPLDSRQAGTKHREPLARQKTLRGQRVQLRQPGRRLAEAVPLCARRSQHLQVLSRAIVRRHSVLAC